MGNYNLIMYDFESYKFLKDKLKGYNIYYLNKITKDDPILFNSRINFGIVQLKMRPLNKKLKYVPKRAIKKIITPKMFAKINYTLPYSDYLDSFYELHDDGEEHQLGPYKTETFNEWLERCKCRFNSNEIYCLEPVISEHFQSEISKDGKTIEFFLPNSKDVVDMHKDIVKLCEDLRLLNIWVSLILPPKNGIDEGIDAILDSLYDMEGDDWYELGKEEEESMDDETDGFWRIQNDLD